MAIPRIRFGIGVLVLLIAAAARGADPAPAAPFAYREIASLPIVADTLALSPDGKILATADAFFNVAWWDVHTGKKLIDVRKAGNGVDYGDVAGTVMRFSPDGKLFLYFRSPTFGEAIVNKAGPALEVWDVASRTRSFTISSQIKGASGNNNIFGPDAKQNVIMPFNGAIFDPEGKRIATVLLNNRMEWKPVVRKGIEVGSTGTSHPELILDLWDVATHKKVASHTAPLPASQDPLGAAGPAPSSSQMLSFTADGKLVACTLGGGLRIWEPAGNKIQVVPGYVQGSRVAISGDGKRVVFQTKSLKPAVKMLKEFGAPLDLDPNYYPLVTEVWSVADKKLVCKFNAGPFVMTSAGLVAAGVRGAIEHVDLDAGKPLESFAAHEKAVASSARVKNVKLPFAVPAAMRVTTLRGCFYDLTATPDGKWLASTAMSVNPKMTTIMPAPVPGTGITARALTRKDLAGSWIGEYLKPERWEVKVWERSSAEVKSLAPPSPDR